MVEEMTLFVCGSIRETVPLNSFATQTASRADRDVAWPFSDPQQTEARPSVRVDARDGASSVFATQTEPRPTAIAPGPLPTLIVWVTVFVSGLIRKTLEPASFVTQTEPAPTAIAVGVPPVGIVLTTVSVAGSTRATE